MKKVAFISGSATGLGKRTALELANQGIDIILNCVKSLDSANQLKELIATKYNVKVIVVSGDISDYKKCEKIIDLACNEMGNINILINNAGPYISERKNLIEYELDEWDKVIQGNLNSVFYLCKLLVPDMRKNHWGRIINIGFDRADTAPGWKYRSAFAAAKTGLVSLTKTLAIEEAEYGITVNMVCPGDIRGSFKEASIKDIREIQDKDTPVGRPGTGEDIARMIAFLCHPDSDFITGSVVQITGGKDVLTKYKYQV